LLNNDLGKLRLIAAQSILSVDHLLTGLNQADPPTYLASATNQVTRREFRR
jgi:hypothetical protein